MAGYIKLYRKSYDNFLYSENRPLTKREAWEDILMNVNWKDSFMLFGDHKVICKRGQSLNSLTTWGKIFKWDKSKVKRFFDLLQSEGMIVTESVQKTTRLTVCNYDTYQDDRNDGETVVKRKRNGRETVVNPIEEVEEFKEGEEEYNSPEKPSKLFKIPTVEEITSYCTERQNNVLPQKFFNFYESKGWMVGKNKMKDWKAAVRTWEGDSITITNKEKMCYFTSEYSQRGSEIHAPYSRYEKELKDFGKDNVKFIRYAD